MYMTLFFLLAKGQAYKSLLRAGVHCTEELAGKKKDLELLKVPRWGFSHKDLYSVFRCWF